MFGFFYFESKLRVKFGVNFSIECKNHSHFYLNKAWTQNQLCITVTEHPYFY